MPFPLSETFDSIEDVVTANIILDVTPLMIDHILKFIQENYEPEDVFEDDKLEKWAEEMGYVKETDDATKE